MDERFNDNSLEEYFRRNGDYLEEEQDNNDSDDDDSDDSLFYQETIEDGEGGEEEEEEGNNGLYNLIYENLYNQNTSNTFNLNNSNNNKNKKQKQEEQNEKPDLISDMPYEVLCNIFSLFDVNTLFSTLLVSKLFNNISNSTEIWKPKCKTNNIDNNLDFILKESTFITTSPKQTTTTTTTTSNNEQSSVFSNSSLLDIKSSFQTGRTSRFYTDDLEPYYEENNQEERDEEEEEDYGSENSFNNNQIQQQKHLGWKNLYFELGSIKLYGEFDLISKGIESSTCDDPNQSIENTLNKGNSFWSSKGSLTSDNVGEGYNGGIINIDGKEGVSCNEYLIYKLEQPICIVSSIIISSYCALFQSGSPIYSPKGVIVSVGFSKDHYHYKSELIPFKQTDKPQTIKLEPLLVIGGYIRLDLIGKYQTQSSDMKYYHAINQVQVEGASIGSLKNKKNLSLSMIQFYSKFQPISNILNFYKNVEQRIDNASLIVNKSPDTLKSNLNQEEEQQDSSQQAVEQLITYEQVLSRLRGIMAPKLDKERIRKQNIYNVINNIVEGKFEIAIDSIFKNDLRSKKIFNICVQSNDDRVINKYFSQLLESGKRFSTDETLFFATQACMEGNAIGVFTRMLLLQRLTPSDQLGQLFLSNGLTMIAAEIFSQCQILDKTIQCLFISGCHEEALRYTRNYTNDNPLDIIYLIKLFYDHSIYQACSFTIVFLRFFTSIRDEINNNNNNRAGGVGGINDQDDEIRQHQFYINNLNIHANSIANIFGIKNFNNNNNDENDNLDLLIQELKKIIKVIGKDSPIKMSFKPSRLSNFFSSFSTTRLFN